MSAIRILHVDDEADIREIVDMSLGLDPDFEVRACSSGAEAIAAAVDWSPSLILLDVMMPGTDGPTTLAQLRKNPKTGDIPVIFMTARAQAHEVEHFTKLGAQGVISKPFDPMTLASLVLKHLQTLRMDELRSVFMRRAKTDTAQLKTLRTKLAKDSDPVTLAQVRQIAHALFGAAGLYGFDKIDRAAKALETAVTAKQLEQSRAREDLKHALDELIARLDNEWKEPSAAVA